LDVNGKIIKSNQSAIREFPMLSNSEQAIDPSLVFEPDGCSQLAALQNNGQSKQVELISRDSYKTYTSDVVGDSGDSEAGYRIISLKASEIKDISHQDDYFKQIVDNSIDVIILFDEIGHATYISPSSIYLLGYTPDEILKEENLMTFVHPDDRDTTFQERKSSTDKREEVQLQRTRLLHKEGHVVWVEILIRRKFNEDGSLIQSVATHRDITNRVKSHRQIEEIKERYELAVEAGHTGVFDYNFRNGKFYPDGSLLRLIGFNDSPRDNNPEKWMKFIHKADRGKIKRSFQNYIRDGFSYFEETFRIIHKSRVTMWVMGRGKIFYDGKMPVKVVCSITDITERVDANEKLKEALVNFESIFNALPDLFFKLNKLGDYLVVKAGDNSDLILENPGAYEGKNIRDTMPPDTYEKFYKCLSRSFESNNVESCEYNLVLDNEKRFFEARIIAVTDFEAVVLIRNISEAVKTNNELINAKKTAEEVLSAREVFFSTMNHEIRTPLNVVIGMSHLLLDQNPREDQQSFLNTLKFSSENLLILINDLLDFSKMQAGKLEFESREFNLEDFVNNIFESYRLSLQNRPINLVKNWHKSVPGSIIGDSSRLAQILNNLLNNAIKFTEKGQIEINISVADRKENQVKLQFSIKDSGIGIPQDKLNDIFLPYQQAAKDTSRRYGGTGLGLTIIKNLIELQEGSIDVKSTEGEGTEFMVILPFTLPVNSDSSSPKKANPLKQSFKEKEIKVLYADDVHSNQFLMKGYCDKWDVNLDIASNGLEAVNLATNMVYDLILLDLQMPVMDGLEATRKIREHEKDLEWDTPVIAVTGDLQTETRNRIVEAGMDDVIIKPIDPQILFDKISDIIQGNTITINPIQDDQTETSEIKTQNDSVVDFSRIDSMYHDAPDLYNHLMELLVKEYSEHHKEILDSIRLGNFEKFREIRHRMASNMKLFHMEKIQGEIDEIKSAFEKNGLPEGGGEYLHKLNESFKELLSELEHKQQQLC